MNLRTYCLLFTINCSLLTAFAGNPDRAGQSGAPELLINPWARSAGWAGANSGAVRGLEAMYLNVAGTAFTPKTEFMFSGTRLYGGSGININAFGFTQKVSGTENTKIKHHAC